MDDLPLPLWAALAGATTLWLVLRLRTLIRRRRRQTMPLLAHLTYTDQPEDTYREALATYEFRKRPYQTPVKARDHQAMITVLIDPDDPQRAHAQGQPPTHAGNAGLGLVAVACWALTWYAWERTQGRTLPWLEWLLATIPTVVQNVAGIVFMLGTLAILVLALFQIGRSLGRRVLRGRRSSKR